MTSPVSTSATAIDSSTPATEETPDAIELIESYFSEVFFKI